MAPLKNWDNKTWLSSKKYIHTFNSFVLKQVKLDKNSRILDIGCGGGLITEPMSRLGANITISGLNVGKVKKIDFDHAKAKCILIRKVG